MIAFALIIGSTFGLLAGLMAFLITYEEYRKHKFSGRQLIREAMGPAILAFVFFSLIMVVVWLVLGRGQSI
jgi:H+/Cl- antiporter ClcA